MDAAYTVIGAGLNRLKSIVAVNAIVCLCCLSSISIVKLPRLCHPCDNQGTFDKLFFKCINDAGEKSDSCKDFTNMSKAIAILQKEAKEVTEAVVKSVTSALGYIPNKVKEIALALLEKMKELSNTIQANIKTATIELGKALVRAMKYVKNFRRNAYLYFFNKYVQPLLDKYMDSIISPIVSILTTAIQLRDDIIAAVVTGMKSIPGLVWDDTGLKDVYAAVTEIVTLIPDHIKDAMVKINGIVSEVKGIGSKITMPFNKLSDGLDEFRELDVNIPGFKIPGFNIPVIDRLPDIQMPKVPMGKVFKTIVPSFPSMDIIPDINFDIFADLTRVHELKDQILGALTVDNVNRIKDLVSEGLTNLFNTVLGNIQLLIYSFVSFLIAIKDNIVKFLYDSVYKTLLKVFIDFKDNVLSDINGQWQQMKTKVIDPIVALLNQIVDPIKQYLNMFITEVKTLVTGLFQDIGNFFKNSSQVIRKAVKVMGRNVISIMIHSFGLMLDVIMPEKWTRELKFQVAFMTCFFFLYNFFGGEILTSTFKLFVSLFVVPLIPGF